MAAARLFSSSPPPSLFSSCPGSTHSQDDKESWALLLPPQRSENALSLQEISRLTAAASFSALDSFLSHFCTFPSSLHNLTFAMRYPRLPFMGEVATATMDSTCLSTAQPLSLSLSLSPLPFFSFPNVHLCHVTTQSLLYSSFTTQTTVVLRESTCL